MSGKFIFNNDFIRPDGKPGLDSGLDSGLDWTGFLRGVFFFLASSLPCMAIQCGSLNMYISPILVF